MLLLPFLSSIIIFNWCIAKIRKWTLFLFINVGYQITDVQLLHSFCPFFCRTKNHDWRTSNSKKIRIHNNNFWRNSRGKSGQVWNGTGTTLGWVCLEYICQHMNSWWWKSLWRRHSLVVWHTAGMVLWVHSALQMERFQSHMPWKSIELSDCCPVHVMPEHWCLVKHFFNRYSET